jgi:hypothetical protein
MSSSGRQGLGNAGLQGGPSIAEKMFTILARQLQRKCNNDCPKSHHCLIVSIGVLYWYFIRSSVSSGSDIGFQSLNLFLVLELLVI